MLHHTTATYRILQDTTKLTAYFSSHLEEKWHHTLLPWQKPFHQSPIWKQWEYFNTINTNSTKNIR